MKKLLFFIASLTCLQFFMYENQRGANTGNSCVLRSGLWLPGLDVHTPGRYYDNPYYVISASGFVSESRQKRGGK